MIPRKHIKSINSLRAGSVEHLETLEEMMRVGKLVGGENCDLRFHCPPFTSVDHLHLHVMEGPYTILGAIKSFRYGFWNVEASRLYSTKLLTKSFLW